MPGGGRKGPSRIFEADARVQNIQLQQHQPETETEPLAQPALFHVDPESCAGKQSLTFQATRGPGNSSKRCPRGLASSWGKGQGLWGLPHQGPNPVSLAGGSEKVCEQERGSALLLLGSSERLVGPWRGAHLGLPPPGLETSMMPSDAERLGAMDPVRMAAGREGP